MVVSASHSGYNNINVSIVALSYKKLIGLIILCAKELPNILPSTDFIHGGKFQVPEFNIFGLNL